MPTATFHATVDGYLISDSGAGGTYTSARNGTATLAASTTGTFTRIGQLYNGSVYVCYETFVSFDTSSLPDDADITSATLAVYPTAGGDETTTDFTIEARVFDFGATITPADWIAGGSLGTHTLVASRSTSDLVSESYNDLNSDPAFLFSISRTGTTRLVLGGSRHRVGNTPTGSERLAIGSSEGTGTVAVRLTVEYDSDKTVSSATATAPAAAEAPTVVINRTIAAEPAAASAAGLEAATVTESTLSVVTAAGTAEGAAPVVLLGDSVAVQPPTATTDATVPQVSVLVNVIVAAVVATASGTLLPPVITAAYFHSKAIIRGGGAAARRGKMSGGVVA